MFVVMGPSVERDATPGAERGATLGPGTKRGATSGRGTERGATLGPSVECVVMSTLPTFPAMIPMGSSTGAGSIS